MNLGRRTLLQKYKAQKETANWIEQCCPANIERCERREGAGIYSSSPLPAPLEYHIAMAVPVKKEKSQVHKVALKGSAKTVAEFFEYSINTILFQRGVYPAEDFSAVKKYGLNMLVSSDDQVKSYVKKIMSQLNKWMLHGKISKLVVVITSRETGEHIERWQFDVQIFNKLAKQQASRKAADKENAAPEYVLIQSNGRVSADYSTEIQRPLRRNPGRPKSRSRKRYKPSFAKSQPRSLFYLCLTGIAPSTCWYMQMQTPMCPSNGATVTQRRSRMRRRYNYEASVRVITRLIP